MIGLFCPTYRRPHVLQAVADNVAATTKNDHQLYFGLEPDDTESIEAAKATGAKVVINTGRQGYPDTIQSIYEATGEELIIDINDDFLFLPDWDEVPVSMFDTDWVQVVGLKQAESDTHMSAIRMFRRKYIEKQSGVIDMPNRVFFPYNHNYCDTEFTCTAQKRGVWAGCDKLGILHQNPGLIGKTEKDYTYRKNDETAHIDEKTFTSRKHLWENMV